jgi:hypothetical protein
MSLDSEGNIWLLTLHGQKAPILLQIPADASRVATIELKTLAGRLTNSALLGTTPSGLVLAWIEDETLQLAKVNADGELAEEPHQVSAEHPVEFFDLAIRPDGDIALWFSGGEDQPGIYSAGLDQGRGPRQVSPAGIRPSLAVAADGSIHAAWIEKPTGQGTAPILYWSEADGASQELATPNIQSSDVFQGPILGLAGDRGYLFYVISIRTGLRAGQVDPMLVSFPLSAPAGHSSPQRLAAPAAYDVTYDVQSTNGLLLGPRAAIASAGATTSQLTQFSLPTTPGRELPLVLRARVDFLMNQNQAQIGLLAFKEGQINGYQLLTFTTGNSQQPAIELDESGYAYLSWLENSEADELSIYLASTRPAWVEQFASLTSDDVQRMVFQSLFGMVSGIILIPMVLLWLIAPVLVILLTSFIRESEQDWRHPLTWLPLLLSVIVYWVVKRGMLPAIFEYVPYSAWVPVIPAWLAPILRLGLPLAGSALALWIAYRSTYGQERNSPTFFILIFGAVDGIISMMLYGGLFLGF